MDIKIRARLSAYSKIDSIPSVDDIKINTVPKQDIDTLFKGEPTETIVTKDDIDTLFKTTEVEETVNKEELETPFTAEEEPVSVTFTEIDSLFK